MTKILTREEWLTYLDTTWKKSLHEAWQKEWDSMTRDDITRMAREAGFVGFDGDNGSLRRFAALVAAAKEAEFAERLRTDVHSCHANCQRVTCVAVREAVQAEREVLEAALLKLKQGIASTSEYIQGRWDLIGEFQDVIRARGNT